MMFSIIPCHYSRPRFIETDQMPKQHPDNTLDRALAKIFPEPSSRRYGRFFEVNQRSVQRWYEIPFWKPTDEQDEKIEKNAIRIAEIDFVRRLEMLMEEAHFADIHPELIAAWLAYHHKRIVGRDIE